MGRMPSSSLRAPMVTLALLGLCIYATALPEKLNVACPMNGASSEVNAGFECSFTKSASVYAPYEMELDIPAVPSFDLHVFVRAVSGSASLSLELELNGKIIAASKGYLSDAALVVPREDLKPGSHVLRVHSNSLVSEATVQISTLVRRTALHPTDKQVLTEFHASCCTGVSDFGPGPFQSFICDNITSWINGHPGSQDDFCNSAPNVCNTQGHIQKAFFRAERRGAASFTCHSPPPGVLAKFTSLHTLDFSNQDLRWALSDLTGALNGSSVERLFIHGTQMVGDLGRDGCAFLQAVPKLNVLWAGNNRLVGSIPKCFVTAPLEQLRLNINGLGGLLPDAFPSTSPLEVLDLEQQNGQFQPLGGPMPVTLSNLKNLLVLNLASNDFTGQIPDLPLSLQELSLSKNKLSGSLPASLGKMQALTMVHIGLGRPDVHGKKISGPLPAGFAQLKKLVFAYLSNNTLTGSLDLQWDMPSLQRLSLSINSFTGPVPASLASGCPQMRFLRLGTNQLTGTLDAYAAAIPTPNYIVGLNMTTNKLSGGMPEGLKKLAVFSNLSYPVTGEFDDVTGAPIIYKNVLVLTHNNFDADYPMWIPEATTFMPNTSIALLEPVDDPNNWVCPPKGTEVSADVFYNVAEVQKLYLCRDDKGKVVELSSLLVVAESKPKATDSGAQACECFACAPLNIISTCCLQDYKTVSSVPTAATTKNSNKKSGLGVGAIVGIVITLLVILMIAAGVAYYVFKRSKQAESKRFEQFDGPESGVKAIAIPPNV